MDSRGIPTYFDGAPHARDLKLPERKRSRLDPGAATPTPTASAFGSGNQGNNPHNPPATTIPTANATINRGVVWACGFCNRPNHILRNPTNCSYCGNHRGASHQEAGSAHPNNTTQAIRPTQTAQTSSIRSSNNSQQGSWVCDKCLERNTGTLNRAASCTNCGHRRSTCCLPANTFREDPRAQTSFWICGRCRKDNYVPANPDRCTRCYHVWCPCCSKIRLLLRAHALQNGNRGGQNLQVNGIASMRGGGPQFTHSDRTRLLQMAAHVSPANLQELFNNNNMDTRTAWTAPTHMPTPSEPSMHPTLKAMMSSESLGFYTPLYFHQIGDVYRDNGLFGGDYFIKLEDDRRVAWACSECGASNSDLTPDFCPICPFRT